MSTTRTTALARGLEYGCLYNGNNHCKIHRFTITSTAVVPNYLQSIGSALSPFLVPTAFQVGIQHFIHPRRSKMSFYRQDSKTPYDPARVLDRTPRRARHSRTNSLLFLDPPPIPTLPHRSSENHMRACSLPLNQVSTNGQPLPASQTTTVRRMRSMLDVDTPIADEQRGNPQRDKMVPGQPEESSGSGPNSRMPSESHSQGTSLRLLWSQDLPQTPACASCYH
jgi:hypothetical protein